MNSGRRGGCYSETRTAKSIPGVATLCASVFVSRSVPHCARDRSSRAHSRAVAMLGKSRRCEVRCWVASAPLVGLLALRRERRRRSRQHRLRLARCRRTPHGIEPTATSGTCCTPRRRLRPTMAGRCSRLSTRRLEGALTRSRAVSIAPDRGASSRSPRVPAPAQRRYFASPMF
jgi:hypothetical protein